MVQCLHDYGNIKFHHERTKESARDATLNKFQFITVFIHRRRVLLRLADKVTSILVFGIKTKIKVTNSSECIIFLSIVIGSKKI